MTQPQYPLNDTPLQPLPPGLVHDLRTPVSHIIGYTEMLIEQAQEAGKEGFIPDLQKVRAAGHELLTLINDRIYQAGQSDPIVTAVPEPTPQGQRAEIPGERPQVPGAAQGSLLVVDDNQGNRDVLSRRLKSQGYLVSTAENGRQALAMLGADPFDLVLLDIMMPEMDGYEVLATLKADEKLRHIPVIMISALSEMDSVVRCIELGAEDYLPKPFNPTLLKARIGACLEKKRGHDREADLFEQLQQNFTRLQELERLRDDLTNMIIHDLRRPLDSVIMGIQTLDALGDLNSGQRQVMDIAVKGGETLVRIINDLLEVENLESGTMQLDRVLLSVGELVASALKKVASEAECKQVTLVQQVPDDLPSLAGDETILRRSLVNLLGNAIKLTPSGGSVTVAAQLSESGNQVELSISDTGNGIPPDAFERIFDKFAQADASKRGAGLGLTYSKLAAESHGGQIGVESTLDQGTTFRVTLPLDSPPADQPSLQEFVALI